MSTLQLDINKIMDNFILDYQKQIGDGNTVPNLTQNILIGTQQTIAPPTQVLSSQISVVPSSQPQFPGQTQAQRPVFIDLEGEDTEQVNTSLQSQLALLQAPSLLQQGTQQSAYHKSVTDFVYSQTRPPGIQDFSTQFSKNWDRDQLVKKSLKQINVKPLITRIEYLVKMFGGPQLAFDMEWKIRLFVIEVMNYAVVETSRLPGFYLQAGVPSANAELLFGRNDAENPIDLDDPMSLDTQATQQTQASTQTRIIPATLVNTQQSAVTTNPQDLQMTQSEAQKQGFCTGMPTLRLDGEKGIEVFGKRVQPDLVVQTNDPLGTMLYIMEIKNFKTIKGKGILKTAIAENFQQLRNFCMLKKKGEATGISTNFGMWIFTRYIKSDEIATQKSTPFMVSHPIEIMDINESKVKEEELQKLILILERLGWLSYAQMSKSNSL
ncbi:hypothetical protein FGO68_gene6230 [Halteria grandinella]|uniref:Uncharacterized protein n=1 Tax=Halteria grandinella TaxID=5974 RepID=A0A8J8NUM9_HALGN|nr:hypothetical protein FGO68_gene6230 [Halteria grandinella]